MLSREWHMNSQKARFFTAWPASGAVLGGARFTLGHTDVKCHCPRLRYLRGAAFAEGLVPRAIKRMHLVRSLPAFSRLFGRRAILR